MQSIIPFQEPILVTRPVLPDLNSFTSKIHDIWDSKWLSNGGKYHKELEGKLRNFLKTPNLSLFNNGTIALIAGLKALKLSGEVITTPFSFPATTHSLTWNNLTPVFCDIDPIDFNLAPEQIERCITQRPLPFWYCTSTEHPAMFYR